MAPRVARAQGAPCSSCVSCPWPRPRHENDPFRLAAPTLMSLPQCRRSLSVCLQEVVSKGRSSNHLEGHSGSGEAQESEVQQGEQQALGGKGRHANSWISHSGNRSPRLHVRALCVDIR